MSSMNLGWVRQQPAFNTIATDDYPSTTTDYNGNVYVAYMTTGTTVGQIKNGNPNIAIVKLDSNGVVLWVTQQPTFNFPKPCQYPSIASDPLGNLYVTYQLEVQTHLFTSTDYGVVTFKLNQDGVFQWSVVLQEEMVIDNNPRSMYSPAIAVDVDGNSRTVVFIENPDEIVVVEVLSNWSSETWLYLNGSIASIFHSLSNAYISAYSMAIRCGNSITVRMSLYLGIDQSILLDTSIFTLDTNYAGWYKVRPSSEIQLSNGQSYNIFIENLSSDGLRVTNAYFPTIDTPVALLVYSYMGDTIIFNLDTNGSLLWRSVTPCPQKPQSISIAIDHNGNSYVADDPSGTTIDVYKVDSSGVFQWDQKSTLFNIGSQTSSPSVAVDPDCNLYLSYQTNGVVSGQTNTGYVDIVVAKFNTSGDVLWLRQQPTFNTTDDDQAPSIAVNSNGNGVCVAYQTNGLASGQTSLGGTGIVVFQMDSSGNTMWVQQNPLFNAYGGGGSGSLLPSLAQVMVGENNYIYVSYFTDGVTSGQTNTGGYDIVVFQLRQSTVYEPVITYGQDGYLYYAYYTSTSVNLFSTGYDVVVVKMNTDGNVIWSQQNTIFDTRFSDFNPSIVTYDSNVYVVYQTEGQVSGGFAMIPYDIVVMKMDGSGNIVWITEQPTFNTTRSNEKPVIDMDSSGNLYVAYQTLGLISGGFKTSMIDRYDLAVFKMDPNANVLWTFQSDVYNNYRGCYNTKIRCDNLNQVACLACTCESNAEGQTFCGYSDILVLKVTYDGVIATTLLVQPWVFEQPTFDTFFPDDNSDICLDGEGNIYVCYCTNGGTISGQTATGFQDVILVKFNSEGDVVKTLQNAIFNSTSDNVNPSIAYHYGFIYVTLQTNGSVSGRSNVGKYDVVIMKVNVVTFDVMWIQQGTSFDTPLDEASPSITTDPEGNCYVAYQTDGFLQGPYSGSLYSYRGIVVTQLYSDGSFGWVSGQI